MSHRSDLGMQMSGRHTLAETERAVSGRLGGLELDFLAMTAVQNLHRAASAIRNYFEQTVLAEAGLSWTGFVVLWVTWIWDSPETRDVAAEAGISKGTLTGVVKTLEGKGLVRRVPMPADGRLVLVQITDAGRDLMFRLFPQVNAAEVDTVSPLKPGEVGDLAATLRQILTHLEGARTAQA
jgi:MarR family transcriptional regulator, organic hydroperoxide resistance regulator